MPKCRNCTATIEPGVAACPFCGTTDPVAAAAPPPEPSPTPTAAPPVDDAPPRPKGQGGSGFGREMKTFSCSSCGAKVSYDPGLKTLACAYCGSTYVIESAASEQTERPERLVAFAHDQPHAEKLFWQWLGKGFFRPRDITKKSAISEIRGVYLPFFAFDADAESDWTADAGYHYTVQEAYTTKDEKGNTVTKHRNVQKTRWQPARGDHAAHYEDWLISASKGLTQDWVAKIVPFDMARAEQYDAGYLAGFAAENPSIQAPVAKQTAHGELVVQEERACDQMVPGDTHRNLRVSSVLRNWSYDLVMLPLWIAAFRYKGKVYRFLVNGQTGEVQGNAPFSYLKLILVILGSAALIGGGVLLYHLFGK